MDVSGIERVQRVEFCVILFPWCSTLLPLSFSFLASFCFPLLIPLLLLCLVSGRLSCIFSSLGEAECHETSFSCPTNFSMTSLQANLYLLCVCLKEQASVGVHSLHQHNNTTNQRGSNDSNASANTALVACRKSPPVFSSLLDQR